MAEALGDRMKWASGLSTKPSLEAAVREVVEQAQRSLQAPADLALLFVSSAFASEYSRLLPLLKEYLTVPVVVGCNGGGVVGMNACGEPQEIEGKAALSLSLAHLPGVVVQAFHLSPDDLPDLDGPPHAWSELVEVVPEDQPHFILLADPMSSGINDLLQGLDFAYPGAVKVGGLASVTSMDSHGTLFCNGEIHHEGVVGVALSGNVVLEAIVAQGVSSDWATLSGGRGERNVMLKVEEQALGTALSGVTQTPLEALQDLFKTLSDKDRELAQTSLFVGVAQSEFKQQLEPGDFLVRNLLGVDPRVGAIAIGDRVRPGQRIQFHLRDAKTSAEDLETLLRHYQDQHRGESSAAGALMFACLGRGEGLYQAPDFDSGLFRLYVQDIPVSGFFCGGEIGPVGGSTFLHGYTSVFGICREP